jgi:hypothetical protein
MVPFHEFFERVARRETRFFTIMEDDGSVPKGAYGVFESYCDEPDCDCRRVFINVIRAGVKAPDATIGFGWEDKAFYRNWMKAPVDDEVAFALSGAQLEPMQRQSDIAPALLELVEELVLSDDAYVERIKRHYRMFREKVDARGDADAGPPQRTVPRVGSLSGPGRNGPCPCGSGRKYKRCCGK